MLEIGLRECRTYGALRLLMLLTPSFRAGLTSVALTALG